MKEVVIVSATRTPVGKFGKAFKDVTAVELGTVAVKGALDKAKIDSAIVDEVILGNVIQAGLGQNVARQAAIRAGIPDTVPSFTINKVCGSALRAVSLAAQIIKAGDADVIVAGGMESMTRAPYILNTGRWGNKMGNVDIVDAMINDALWDAFNDYHMGMTAENIADRWNLTRQELDEFALESQRKAENAIKSGEFTDEITPVIVKSKKGDIVIDTDEQPRFGSTIEGLAKLKPSFKEGGVVTAGNASGLNDGAAAVIVMSADKAKELGIEPLAKIVSYASAGLDPSIMGYGPYYSTKKALEKVNMNMDDIDLIEANEAFVAQSLAVARDLEFNMDKVNVNGGATALGHPVGASGARILVTLLYAMKKRGLKTGLATLCIGGGQGTSLIVER